MSLQGGDNQESLNAVCVIAMVDRLWQLSGKEPAWLEEFCKLHGHCWESAFSKDCQQ